MRQYCATHRFLDSGWPAFVQHRAALRVIYLKTQREADWTDVICCVLWKQKGPHVSFSLSWCLRLEAGRCFNAAGPRRSHRHGKAVCGTEFVLCELRLPAESVCGSCRQTGPALTTSCHPTSLTPTDLRGESVIETDGQRWKIHFLTIIWAAGRFTTLIYSLV